MSEEITIKTEKDLMSFLKVVAEESFNKSISQLNESEDPGISSYRSNYKVDAGTYSLSEQEEAPEPEGEDDLSDTLGFDFESKPEEEDAGEDKEPVAAEPKQAEGDDFAVSFDSIITAINTLRSGRSLKDKEVKSGVSQYYDKLTEEERMVMYTFLGALSKILTGAVDGSEAQDPSDDPLNFKITTADEEADQEAAADAEKIAPAPEEEQQGGEDSEDTSPPIELTESQDIEQLRIKVRKLMER
jgi:hypothetical protein